MQHPASTLDTEQAGVGEAELGESRRGPPSVASGSRRFLTDSLVGMGCVSRARIEEAVRDAQLLGTTPERVLVQQGAGGGDDRLRLVAVEPAGLDVARYLRRLRTRKVRRRGKPRKEGRCDQIHPAVGALGREDHRHQQLQIGPVIELDPDGRIGVIEPVDDRLGANPSRG